jgi:hypothetical protein
VDDERLRRMDPEFANLVDQHILAPAGQVKNARI